MRKVRKQRIHDGEVEMKDLFERIALGENDS